ncbi:MAG: hypothetical protein ABSG69_15865, partial [Candidatus Acidiferrum sp.]
NWKTRASNPAVKCLIFQWMTGPVLLVTPTLFKPICSDVDVSGCSLADHAADGAAENKDDNG